MRLLAKLFRRKQTSALSEEQAVLVHLDGMNLPDETYKKYDVSTLEDQLIEVIKTNQLGEYDGNEFGPEVTTLFMYGPDAERLFAAIAPVLRAYPLCSRARVVIRRGPPGAPERDVQFSTQAPTRASAL